MVNILIVDDEASLRDMVASKLQPDYTPFLAEDAMQAFDILQDEDIHLAVVDVMMPYMNGFELCKHIKNDYDIPVIMLTARSELYDKREAYQAGTDDYMTKPFEPEELKFRIEAVLSRYGQSSNTTIGNVTLDSNAYLVEVDSETLYFPRKEFELLEKLFINYPNVCSRDMLIEEIWGYDFEGDERTVDVHIKRVRKRLSAVNSRIEIKTVRGIGYQVHEL
ncbi:response regulator transcription factor [Nosocomiicoccus massiliensis]|uniref:response regulator transcription factor n=1 Tax=Nosocomiicoccus massiliensis TaxID=1232430 RepID=UPI00042A7E9F|nr:response regulator transcription factor [Nosocomiicoccus massiliensis]